MNRGEIWLVDLNGGRYSEQNGVRPCLIVQNNIGNKYSPATIVCPITTRDKHFTATHLKIEDLTSTSYIMFEQIRVVDKERIIKYITTLDAETMWQANQKLKVALSL